ncbi:hypothetical protein ACJ6WD_35560 [Streptomyces sp. VTCC 41912]|uniref:hypothetical protein n=1 Tax=Streptomyces sp. VTCC 41912 TaxID=3383243 RepID=UPI003896BCD7
MARPTTSDKPSPRSGGPTAAAALAAALARLGIVLPSLRDSAVPVNGRPFVELGGCGAPLASQLAQRINEAVDALDSGAGR